MSMSEEKDVEDSNAQAEAASEAQAEADVLVEKVDGGIIYPGGWDEPTPQQKHDMTLAAKNQARLDAETASKRSRKANTQKDEE